MDAFVGEKKIATAYELCAKVDRGCCCSTHTERAVIRLPDKQQIGRLGLSSTSCIHVCTVGFGSRMKHITTNNKKQRKKGHSLSLQGKGGAEFKGQQTGCLCFYCCCGSDVALKNGPVALERKSSCWEFKTRVDVSKITVAEAALSVSGVVRNC